MINKRILLIICGSVAAYKSLEILRELKRLGATIDVVLTAGAQQFITPLSASALSGEKTYTELFSLNDEVEMGHIALARRADLILVCPASADFIAKVAHGFADDLATTIMLAADCETIFAPAMNPHMWANAATKSNIEILASRGVIFIEPEKGEAACGEVGVGRLAAIEKIISAAQPHNRSLAGKHFIVTAGGTHEKIDPVRFIGNYSSGKQGFAIAEALANAGSNVTLIYGAVSQSLPKNVKAIQALSANEMLACIEDALPADGAICAAAVADWQAKTQSPQKLKKNDTQNLTIEFVKTPDILAYIGTHKTMRPKLVIGFAAETENLIEGATAKLKRKNCDFIIANNVTGGAIFGEDKTNITCINAGGSENFGELSKVAVANKLVKKITEFFNETTNY